VSYRPNVLHQNSITKGRPLLLIATEKLYHGRANRPILLQNSITKGRPLLLIANKATGFFTPYFHPKTVSQNKLIGYSLKQLFSTLFLKNYPLTLTFLFTLIHCSICLT